MNRETSIHSSDTLVVVDRSRRRRRLLIAAIAAIAVVVIALALIYGRGGSDTKSLKTAGAAAGQVPTVTVVVPGRSQVGRVVTASGPLAARRDQPVGIAGQGGRVVRVLVDAGSWVRAGQVLAVIDRSVQAQQAAQLAAQVEAAKADAALAQSNYERAHRPSGPRLRVQGRNRFQEGQPRRRLRPGARGPGAARRDAAPRSASSTSPLRAPA